MSNKRLVFNFTKYRTSSTISLVFIHFYFLYFQLSLIRAGWNELLIAAFSFKSTHLNEDGIRLSDGTVIAKDEAHMAGMIDNRHIFLEFKYDCDSCDGLITYYQLL